MTPRLLRRTGFEIELMAPPGLSRRTLAVDLAARCGGRVHPVWHRDSEPSLVPGLGRFLHLTQGFEVRRADGALLCTLVDDVTLLADLDPRAPAAPGWFRILTDDGRLLHLLAAHSDPGGTLGAALDGPAQLWGTRVQRHDDDVYVLEDPGGATIALAAAQGAGRERPCEIVTPPLADDHGARLEELLGPARELGFTVPREAAVHLHLDGAPFREAYALANVVRLFASWREPLRTLLQTNPACRRLAPLPEPLVEAARGVPSYEDLRKAAEEGELTKFFDVNLTQLLTDTPLRDTIEIRILPGAIETADVLHRAALVELLLDRCLRPEPFPEAPADPQAALQALLEVAADVLAGRDEVAIP
ncbi:amidoligase family protein [Nucisporomicrobium flavum]|uniref:amidoligase family protein n=1 Tax=Nucisporomicrobium flavum TaxID=2785915 RepID=UPI0018F60770|nr:amidoligase family protein [Nucisporomicrobium flavum]